MITDITHKLLKCFEHRESHLLRVTFVDSDIFVLRGARPVDTSVYDVTGQWTAEIIEVISVPVIKQKVHVAGAGLDFMEKDIREVFDATTCERVF